MPADIVRYLTHPQVQIDPDVPVPQWGLSSVGWKSSGRSSAELAAHFEVGFDGVGASPMHRCTSPGTL